MPLWKQTEHHFLSGLTSRPTPVPVVNPWKPQAHEMPAAAGDLSFGENMDPSSVPWQQVSVDSKEYAIPDKEGFAKGFSSESSNGHVSFVTDGDNPSWNQMYPDPKEDAHLRSKKTSTYPDVKYAPGSPLPRVAAPTAAAAAARKPPPPRYPSPTPSILDAADTLDTLRVPIVFPPPPVGRKQLPMRPMNEDIGSLRPVLFEAVIMVAVYLGVKEDEMEDISEWVPDLDEEVVREFFSSSYLHLCRMYYREDKQCLISMITSLLKHKKKKSDGL